MEQVDSFLHIEVVFTLGCVFLGEERLEIYESPLQVMYCHLINFNSYTSCITVHTMLIHELHPSLQLSKIMSVKSQSVALSSFSVFIALDKKKVLSITNDSFSAATAVLDVLSFHDTLLSYSSLRSFVVLEKVVSENTICLFTL